MLFQVEQIVDGLGGNNLTKVIIVAFIRCGGLTREDVSKKLLCFGANGTFIFQGGEQVLQGKSKMFGHPFQWVSIVKLIGQPCNEVLVQSNFFFSSQCVHDESALPHAPLRVLEICYNHGNQRQ
jgi:hypothetical protein